MAAPLCLTRGEQPLTALLPQESGPCPTNVCLNARDKSIQHARLPKALDSFQHIKESLAPQFHSTLSSGFA